MSEELRLGAGYNFDQDGFRYPVGNRPHIKWDHPDGPLLYLRNGEIHWLTGWELYRCWLKWDDAESLERKHRPSLTTAEP